MTEKKLVEDQVKDLVALRDELSAERKRFKEYEANQKLMIEQIEVQLLERAREVGTESFKTKYGTAFKTTKTFVRVADWPVILAYIIKSENWQMFEKRLAKLATIEVLEDIESSEGLAPADIGVEFIEEEVMQVRRGN